MRAIMNSASGNLIEWFDFYTYSFTSVYFASQFFPSNGNTIEELLKAAGVFFIGFLMRPIGGWLFGYIADKYGRKIAMLLSIYMMCAGSFAIALLPTYQAIGIWAPLLLLIIRMFQGLSVGGEYGTVATYISEVAQEGKRGFYGAFQYVTLIGGQLLASLSVFILTLILSETELKAWGWRIPFFIGGLAAIVALFLRDSLHESTSEKNLQKKEAGSLKDLLINHKKAFILVVCYTAGGSLTFYTYTTYMQKYLITTSGFDKSTATLIMTSVLFVFMLMQPIFGLLADKIGTRKSLFAWSILSIFCTMPLLKIIGHTQHAWTAFFCILVLMTIACLYTSIAGIIKAEMFPAYIRASGVGISYAIGNAMFGGSAEYIALWFKSLGIEQAFYYYITFMMVIALIAVYLMPDAKKHSYLNKENT